MHIYQPKKLYLTWILNVWRNSFHLRGSYQFVATDMLTLDTFHHNGKQCEWSFMHSCCARLKHVTADCSQAALLWLSQIIVFYIDRFSDHRCFLLFRMHCGKFLLHCFFFVLFWTPLQNGVTTTKYTTGNSVDIWTQSIVAYKTSHKCTVRPLLVLWPGTQGNQRPTFIWGLWWSRVHLLLLAQLLSQ